MKGWSEGTTGGFIDIGFPCLSSHQWRRQKRPPKIYVCIYMWKLVRSTGRSRNPHLGQKIYGCLPHHQAWKDSNGAGKVGFHAPCKHSQTYPTLGTLNLFCVEIYCRIVVRQNPPWALYFCRRTPFSFSANSFAFVFGAK